MDEHRIIPEAGVRIIPEADDHINLAEAHRSQDARSQAGAHHIIQVAHDRNRDDNLAAAYLDGHIQVAAHRSLRAGTARGASTVTELRAVAAAAAADAAAAPGRVQLFVRQRYLRAEAWSATYCYLHFLIEKIDDFDYND